MFNVGDSDGDIRPLKIVFRRVLKCGNTKVQSMCLRTFAFSWDLVGSRLGSGASDYRGRAGGGKRSRWRHLHERYICV